MNPGSLCSFNINELKKKIPIYFLQKSERTQENSNLLFAEIEDNYRYYQMNWLIYDAFVPLIEIYFFKKMKNYFLQKAQHSSENFVLIHCKIIATQSNLQSQKKKIMKPRLLCSSYTNELF